MQNLKVNGITKLYNGKKALDDVSFNISAGQIVGLLGPNGAGKTTTMSIMTGILAPDSGEVLFDGEKMTPANEIAIKEKIGFLSEANPLYTDMLVSEYLDYVAEVRGISKDKKKEAIAKVLKETGIEDKYHQPIEELSKGYKQRVGLAQAILHQPEILILDEPTEGLDPNQRVTIRDLIGSLGKERTVLISTHVLSEVQAVCDRVIILNQGKVVSEGSVESVISQGQQGQKVSFEAQGSDIRNAIEKDLSIKIVDHKPADGKEKFILMASGEADIRPKLFNMSKENGWTVYDLHQEATSLEDIFRSLTLES